MDEQTRKDLEARAEQAEKDVLKEGQGAGQSVGIDSIAPTVIEQFATMLKGVGLWMREAPVIKPTQKDAEQIRKEEVSISALRNRK